MSLEHLLKATTITHEMVQRRDQMKTAYGDRYATVIKDPRRIVLAIAQRDHLPVIQAALKICQTAVQDGHGSAVNLVIAATVDLIEEGKVNG